VTWSSAGSAASYPSARVSFITPQGSNALIVRLDPVSKIVYIVGNFASPATTGQLTQDPLPEQFRPIANQRTLAGTTSATVNAINILPTGHLTTGSASGWGSGITFFVNGLYFTDV
jgi:hypothetical protein